MKVWYPCCPGVPVVTVGVMVMVISVTSAGTASGAHKPAASELESSHTGSQRGNAVLSSPKNVLSC